MIRVWNFFGQPKMSELSAIRKTCSWNREIEIFFKYWNRILTSDKFPLQRCIIFLRLLQQFSNEWLLLRLIFCKSMQCMKGFLPCLHQVITYSDWIIVNNKGLTCHFGSSLHFHDIILLHDWKFGKCYDQRSSLPTWNFFNWSFKLLTWQTLVIFN